MENNPLNRQIGGEHYKQLAYQPVEFISKIRLSFCAGNVLKYVLRYDNKNGKEDLKKALHYISIIGWLKSNKNYTNMPLTPMSVALEETEKFIEENKLSGFKARCVYNIIHENYKIIEAEILRAISKI